MKRLLNTQGVLPFCAGLIAGCGMLFPSLWYVSIFGIAIFIHTLIHTKKSSLFSNFLNGCVFGISYTGVSLIWFWHILPLDWIGAPPLSGVLFVLFSWGIVTVCLGTLFGLFSALLRTLHTGALWDVLLVPSLWVVVQYAHMWVFALLTWNMESLLGAHFSATFIGYALASFSPLLQLASIGGVYLLTFAAVTIAYLLYVCTKYLYAHNRIILLIYIVALFPALTALDHAYTLVRENTQSYETKTVALLSTHSSPDIPRSEEEYLERRIIYAGAFKEWAREHATPDIAIFPEGGRDREISTSSIEAFGHDSFGEAKVAVIDSGIVKSGEAFSERMFAWDPTRETVTTYDKQFLVPQGEYTPYLAEIILSITGANKLSEQIRRAERSYVRGKELEVIELNTIQVGALFCSEILSPSLYRHLSKEGASLLVNASSLAVFHGSTRVDSFVLMMGKVRAVENGRFMTIASHEAPASVISNRGTVLARSPYATTSVLAVTVPLVKENTLYATLGEYILLIPVSIVVLFTVRRLLYSRKHLK